MKCHVYIWGGGSPFTDRKLRWLTEFCTRPGNVSMVQLNISLCFICKRNLSPHVAQAVPSRSFKC